MTASKNSGSTGPSLNVYKKIAVIRKPSDSLSYEDGQGNVKTVSAEQLGDAISTATPLTTTSKIKQDIPVPLIRGVGSYAKDVSSCYEIPLSYVRYHRPTVEEFKETLEYVLDAEDEAWLENNVRFGGAVKTTDDSHPPSRLSMELFERMIDILEKETGFDSIITTNKAEVVFREQLPELFDLFPHKPRSGVVATKHVLNDVYTYWMQKRSRLKRPLLRKYWPVTSLDDTNPHLVFRPREKEKYKLRKKRQNDIDAYRKMKVLRQDFDSIRQVLILIQKREELSHLHLKLQIELHRQKLYDLLDTSGCPRQSNLVRKGEIAESLDIPQFFDTQPTAGAKNRNKNGRNNASAIASGRISVDLTTPLLLAGSTMTSLPGKSEGVIVAGQNHGTPAPNFLQPLYTRESYVTSWDGAVPHVSSYTDSQPDPTHSFRYRPRIGRGGRVCLDRLPRPPHPNVTPITFFTAGRAVPDNRVGQEPLTTRLLDLLPRPLETERIRRRVEEICVASIYEDMVMGAEHDPENDGEEVVVRLEAWLDTDDHLWGEERHALGPL